jgi:capsular polysaccharide biosynthesis protein
MDIRKLLAAIKQWWWLGALPVVIVLVLTIISYKKPAPVYQVAMRFATGSEPASILSDDYDRYYAWLTSEYIANGLADIAVSDSFASKISQTLSNQGLAISPGAVRGAIASDNTQSTVFIYLTWGDPTQAVQLAEVISDTLIQSGPVYYPQMAQVGAVARLIDTPTAQPLPIPLRVQIIGPAIRIALAAGAGFGLMLLAYVLDPAVRTVNELAEKNLTVLGSIPKTAKNQ